MAADGGGMIFGGRPLTLCSQRIAGSFKMAADDGGMIFGGRPLTKRGKRIAGAVGTQKKHRLIRQDTAFNDTPILIHQDKKCSPEDTGNVSRGDGTAPIGIPRGGFPSGIGIDR